MLGPRVTLFLARQAFSPSIRLRTWRKLAAQYRHNLGMVQSIELLRDRARARRSLTAHTFDVILERMHTGQSLGVALRGLIPPEETLLIAGGDDGAGLADALTLCAGLIEAKREITGALIRELSYPALLVALFLGLLVTIAGYVMPNVSMLFDPALLTGSAATLHGVSTFVASGWGIATLAALVVGLVVAMWSLPTWCGPYRLRVEGLPPWSFYRLIVGSVWLFTTSTLMRSGMQLNHVLESQLTDSTQPPWLLERIRAIHAEVALGKHLGAALADSNMRFPDEELIEDLCIYAELPRFHEQLHTLATEWLTEGVARISQQAKILNVACILGIVALLSGVALAISSLQQQLSTTGGF